MISTEKLMEDFGKEMTLIILCCRFHFGTTTLSDINLFISQSPPNDGLFLKLCRIHRIRPIAFKVVLQTEIAADLKNTVKNEFFRVIAENWKKSIETERIVSILQKENIVVSVYKGAAFTKQFYSEMDLRESSDIDLVIEKNDLDLIIKILEEDGYNAELKDIRTYLGDQYFHYYKDSSFTKFVNKKRISLIEMHWRVSENHFDVPTLANSLIYDSKEDIQLINATVPTVNKTSHFLSVFIHHTIKDTFRNLKAMVDIAQCFTHHSPEIEWDKVEVAVDDFNLSQSLDLSIFLSQELLGVPSPINRNINIKDKTGKHFINQLCADTLINLNNKMDGNYFYNQLLVRNNFANKIAFSANYIKCLLSPMEPDFRLFRLPKRLFFLYPLLKPFRPLLEPKTTGHNS
jgi:hypothetical protein